MNETFDDQNIILVTLKRYTDLMSRQLDFLIRNNKQLTDLDLDVLMGRTHQIYELLCSAHIENKPISVPFEVETNNETEPVITTPIEKPKQEVQNQISNPASSVAELTEPLVTPTVSQQNVVPEVTEQPAEPLEAVPSQPVDNSIVFNFDDTSTKPEVAVSEKEEKSQEEIIFDEPKNIVSQPEKNVEPQVEPIEKEQIAKSNKPAKKVETVAAFDTKTRSTNDVEPVVTIADAMMHDDDSLAAKLQRQPVSDLKKAIGINDKFLFVNELFSGSMEKYNKAITTLNEVPTLSGAQVCLNELRIELQWSSNSDAYKKLKDLVIRRFDNH